MARGRAKAEKADPANPVDERTRQLERIARLLGLLVIKGEGQTSKVLTLVAAGFTPAEVADLLGTTPNTVSVTVYQEAKRKAKPGPRTRRAD